MNLPVARHELLLRYISGVASENEIAQLEESLTQDAEFRQLFLEYLSVDLALSNYAEANPYFDLIAESVGSAQPPSRCAPAAAVYPNRPGTLLVGLIATVVLMLGVPLTRFVVRAIVRTPIAETSTESSVATVGELTDCRLNGADRPLSTGGSLASGQRIDLASGMMTVKFASGALATIYGPAIFDINSRNSGFLTSGRVNVAACGWGTTDFSLKTANANAVNNCSEYAVEVASDQRTRFGVTSGSLRIYIPTIELSQRLESGGSLGLCDLGADQVMTLIESGDGTPAFRFPTISPPSSSDLADQSRGIAKIHCFGGELSPDSGSANLLLDGRGQSDADAWGESLFFLEHSTGLIVVDLGQRTSLSMINTYSWHRSDSQWHKHWAISDKRCSDRAVQKYDLYGYAGDEMPQLQQPLANSGWQLISQVNTDDFFHVDSDGVRPPQQASSVRGALGSYRYLLWAVRPSIGCLPITEFSTFYGEIDIFESL